MAYCTLKLHYCFNCPVSNIVNYCCLFCLPTKHLKSPQELVQHVSVHSRSNWNLTVLVFEERGQIGVPSPRKTSQIKERTNNKLNPHMTPERGIKPKSHCHPWSPLLCFVNNPHFENTYIYFKSKSITQAYHRNSKTRKNQRTIPLSFFGFMSHLSVTMCYLCSLHTFFLPSLPIYHTSPLHKSPC